MRPAFRSILLLLCAPWLAALLGNAAIAAPPATQTPTATPTPSMMSPDKGWLRVPELPEGATQADYGAEVYRLVCEACHGDDRRGLTPEWIAKWPESQQNCWDSKCHAPNHPPDGFDLPRYVPPLGGENALRRFPTALDLYDYMSKRMPWHNPGSLTENQYWQLTAFLIREQEIAPMTSPLTSQRAGQLRLNPDAASTAQPEPAPAGPAGNLFWWTTVAALAAIIGVIALLLYLRRHAGRDDNLG